MSANLYYPNGELKAKFIRTLNDGECCCQFDNLPEYFTDGNKLFMFAQYVK